MRKLLIVVLFIFSIFVPRAFAYEITQPLGKPAPSSPEYEKYIKQKTMLEEKKKKIEAELQRVASEDVAYMKSMMEADRERDMWNEIEKHIISVEKAEPQMDIYGSQRTMSYKKSHSKLEYINIGGDDYFLEKTYRINAFTGQCLSSIKVNMRVYTKQKIGTDLDLLEVKGSAVVDYMTPLPNTINASTPIEYLEYLIGAKLRAEAGRYIIARTFDYYFAERAGLKPGDVILTIDGIAVSETNLYNGLIGYIKKLSGNTRKITILRDGKEITVYHTWKSI